MSQKLRYLFLITLFVFPLYAQHNFWKPITAKTAAKKLLCERKTTPSESLVYELNLEGFKAELKKCSNSGNYNQKTTPVVLEFPNSEGDFISVIISEKNVLHPELAEKFPHIKSYTGTDSKGNNIRFSLTDFGLHAQIFTPNGTEYIDPYTQDATSYIVYDRKSIQKKTPFTCLNKEVNPIEDLEIQPFSKKSALSDGVFRTYRLAMATTVEYSDFHIKRVGVQNGTLLQKQSAVISALNVTITRVNGIFEKEFATTLQLVPNNTNIIFINSDNFTNSNGEDLLEEVQPVINAAIGFNNYDIGHVVSTGGGGVAYLESVCGSNKAKGVTGASAPVGDPFDIDFVVHEIGHQFGAYHTFNNSCEGSISFSASYEPGSGSTIMAYAGICNPNVQNQSDDYFHAKSVDQIITFIQNLGNCSQNTILNNNPPIISPLNNYTIPHSTPFKLTGNATDNENTLTYCWEQYDRQQSKQPPVSQSTIGPVFRSFKPTSSPVRYFPNIEDVLAGNSTPWEVLPSVKRDLNFVLTVRDNHIEGGQTTQSSNKVNIASVGPFRITSQNSGNAKWIHNQYQIINWDVAGTDGNGINTSLVNIKLSVDGGENFDVILAENTPNDGTEAVKAPDLLFSNNCRLLIEPVDNIYFAVNTKPFSIGSLQGGEDEFILFGTQPAQENIVFNYLPKTKTHTLITIYDSWGRLVFQQKYFDENYMSEKIDIHHLQSGVYIFQLEEAGAKKTKKFIVSQ